jgi:hypothetical protein
MWVTLTWSRVRRRFIVGWLVYENLIFEYRDRLCAVGCEVAASYWVKPVSIACGKTEVSQGSEPRGTDRRLDDPVSVFRGL